MTKLKILGFCFTVIFALALTAGAQTALPELDSIGSQSC